MTRQSCAEHNEPQHGPSAESITNTSGGAGIDAQHDVNIGGDVVGRDKITEIIEGDKVAGDKIIEQQVTATGRAIAIGKLNLPLMPVVVALGVGLAVLTFVGLMATLTHQDIQRYAPTPAPGIMTGDIKVAVAEFGVVNDQHKIIPSVEGQEYARSFVIELQKNLDALGEELTADGFKYQIAPVRGPPEVRLIEGNMPVQRRWNAEKVAGEHGADILLYGYLDISPISTTLNVEFYVSDQFLRDAEELTGAQPLGDPKIVGADIQANVTAKADLRTHLKDETRAFALFLIGLGHFGLEHYQEAESFFHKAIDAESLGDPTIRKIYYLFAGKAVHEYATNLSPELQRLEWTKAQDYLSKSLSIDPAYARARLGYADIAFQKAKDNCEPGKVDARGLQEAIDGYQQALTAWDKIKMPDANIDNKTSFYLGRAYLCQSMAGIAVRWTEAETETQKVIDQGGNGADSQEESMQMRVAEAYANLGVIYWVRPQPDRLLAADQFNRAIEVNQRFVNGNRRLDRQALFNGQLAEIYEQLRDYDKANRAWEEALRYEALWYKEAGQTMPTPSLYQQTREKYAAGRLIPANERATRTP